MAPVESHAWVTSVTSDEDTIKALVLAGSLRRVFTTKKLVAICAPNLSQNSRDFLREKFDLVVGIDQEIPDELHPNDFPKIFAFSLTIFHKIVYLALSTMVVQNCDDIFEKDSSFAVAQVGEKNVETSVFLCIPSLVKYKCMREIVANGHRPASDKQGMFTSYFGKWLFNQDPSAGFLEPRYNQMLSLMDEKEIYDGLQSDLGVINFIDVHPIEIADKIMSSGIKTLGVVESYVADKWLMIYMDEKRAQSEMPNADPMNTSNENKVNEPIAIVGMACRYPSANNPDEFWKLLAEGREGIKPVPHSRWTKDRSIIPNINRSETNAGFLNTPVDEFDAKFFGISPKEAVFIDPQQRLLHEITWEALEDAAIDPSSLYGTLTGVFVGSWIYDYKDIIVRVPDTDFFRVYMGNSVAAGAARLSYFLGTTGPSVATESGCSSAIVAVDMGVKSLRNGDTKLAIACGVNLLLHPFEPSMLSFVVADDGRCKTFDSKANGFGRAEGCGVLLMKRLSDAVKNGDKIWGLIKGSAVAQEGISKSFGTPTVTCEALAMSLALKDAGVQPGDVTYVETHGTGTPVGDPLETTAIAKVYSKGRTKPLVIGSVKTNVGHTESCSGITGIMKVVLSMKNNLIPRHLNFDMLNPEINLDLIPAQIPLTEVPWPRTHGKPRIAGVSSFGISGTDGHVIVQEAPEFASINKIGLTCSRPMHIMKVSAKTGESLDALLDKHADAFDGCTETFADYAYTANVGRATFSQRAVVIAKDFTEAKKCLESKSLLRNEVAGGGGKLCFLFTGQGSQYPGMGAKLYESSPVYRMSFEKCSKILQRHHGISIKDVLWGQTEELNRTLYSQTAIFCVEYSLLKLWESWGVKPDFVLGHSLGEFAAAVACGALTLNAALHLVAQRSRLIDSLPQGKMIVVKADKSAVESNLNLFKQSHPNTWLDYAALNSPEQTVLAGDTNTVDAFAQFCEEKKLKTIILASTHAFHSRHMDPMLEAYAATANTVLSKMTKSSCQYISGVTGHTMEISELDVNYWLRHTREKVNFIEACKSVQSEGCTFFLEVGPHPVLSALAMVNISQPGLTCFPSLRKNQEEWPQMLESLGKLYVSDWNGTINWKGFDDYFVRRKVDTVPFYQFTKKKVWAEIYPVPSKLHPLLGSRVENASTCSIYENAISLKKLGYLQDHVIGNTVVFPGAGFLEMCLSAGFCHVQGLKDDFTMPKRPISLQGLKIESPLAISDSSPTTMQVCVNLVDTSDDAGAVGYQTKVHHWYKTEGDGHWVSHAGAVFIPYVADDLGHLTKVDITQLQAEWPETSMSTELYKKLPEIGLRFGPTFQSLLTGWKSETEQGILVAVKVPADVKNYIAHPILIDAMFQVVMLWCNKDRLHKKLHVPVHVGEFTWLRVTDSDTCYVHCGKDIKDMVRVSLVDENGECLMSMSQIDFIETTAAIVESMMQQQASALPKLWQEIWRSKPGPHEDKLTTTEEMPEKMFSDEILEKIYAMNELNPEENKIYKHLDGATVDHFLNALYQLGWNVGVGESFTIPQLMSSLSIVDTFKNYVRFYIKELVKDNFLSEKVKDTFTVTKPLKTLAELSFNFDQLASDKLSSRGDYKLTYHIGRNLASIFTGKVHPLAVIFPEETGADLVDSVYDILRKNIAQSSEMMIDAVLSLYKSCSSKIQNAPGKLRILEVGAGTGAHTGVFLKGLESLNIPYEFYYTDVSASFFPKAEIKYAEHASNMVFKKFDMEMDPMSQGFSPGYFHMIIGMEVIHISKHIRQVLSNLRLLLTDNGTIQIVETTVPDRRITFMFGLLDGYWRFEDFDLRPDHVTLSPAAWENVLNSTGFKGTIALPSYGGVHSNIMANVNKDYYFDGVYSLSPDMPCGQHLWAVFGDHSELTRQLVKRMEGLGRDIILFTKREHLDKMTSKNALEIILEVTSGNAKRDLEGVLYLWGLTDTDERNQANVAQPYLYLCQYLWDSQKIGTKVILVTQGLSHCNEAQSMSPGSSTLIGMSKVLRTETSIYLKCIDLTPKTGIESQVGIIMDEMWLQDHENLVTYQDDKRHGVRLISKKVTDDSLPLPKGTDRFQLILPDTKVIQDLKFGFLNKSSLGEHDVEVKIKACALNFRDVFVVLKPVLEFEKYNTIASDFAGIVTAIGSKVKMRKVGDAVFGCDFGVDKAMPSHHVLNEKMLASMPDTFTFAEACTLPAVFSTSLYCLVILGKLQVEETILIHTGSGGVGLSAIQIAHHCGATVIATAGSERKRNYLRSLGVEHVFNSRNTNFEGEIMTVTKGKGVNFVLNSLTGPGFKEASLNTCAPNARFIEMSKLSIWTKDEIHELRPDVQYHIVDLTQINQDSLVKLYNELEELIQQEKFKPIPYVRFDAVNIRAALSYLQKAKHIGKVVCIMPDIKIQDSQFTSLTPLFNDRSTYIITGGVNGGIGFEVAKWMLSQGAKHLLLVGRTPPINTVREMIAGYNSTGNNVQTISADVGDYDQCKKIFGKIKTPSEGFPPLRGIMHAAGTLSDGTIPNQTWDKFENTYNGKVKGSWNLHDLSINDRLEHFVFFSSLSALFGTPGQANHSSGNYFEDSLAHHRNFEGLPATTVNWGNWGQVGIATDIELPGIRPLSTAQGLAVLNVVLRQNILQSGALNVESFSVFAKLCPSIKHYVDDKSLLAEAKGPVFNLNSDEFWAEVDGVEDRSEKEEVFKKSIKTMLKSLLKMDADENIDDDAEFQTLGVDSLMMLEMKNNLQNIFGSRMIVSASDLKDCNTSRLLGSKLVDIFLSTKQDEVIPSPEELKALINEDSQLPTLITGNGLQGAKLPSQVKTVLVTGATGTLAPFVIRNLSNMGNISKIICLIRKRRNVSSEERFVSNASKTGILSDIDIEKLEFIEGDVTETLLGLSQSDYDSLAESVDCVVHSAIKMDHVQIYRRSEANEKFHIRSVNVIGTKNVLQFAAMKTTKIVMYASTFAMICTMNEDKGCLSETWEPQSASDNFPVNNGYVISKFVSEQLVRQAVERGIPCKSFRFPFIAGESSTGQHDIQGNHQMLRFLTYMKIRVMPSLPLPIIHLPVDLCADIMTKIFFNDESPTDAYNVLPKEVNLEQEFCKLAADFGHPVKIVEYSEFLEKLNNVGESSPMHAFRELYQDENLVKTMTTSPAIPSIEKFLQNYDNYFKSEKLRKYCPELYSKMKPTIEIVEQDLKYLKETGLFAKFGL